MKIILTALFLILYTQSNVHAQFSSSNCDNDGERFNVCSIQDETLRNLVSNNFSATTSCIASTTALESSGVKVPKCDDKDFQMLDNTHPTGGIFMGYVPNQNIGFIEQLGQASQNSAITVNIVVNIQNLPNFNRAYTENPELKRLVDAGNVNLIPVNASSGAVQWMQDSMQFTTMDNKVGIVQLEQWEEDRNNVNLENRIACQIAQNCNLPIMQTPYADAKSNPTQTGIENGNYRAGGNLEVFPGGLIVTGGSEIKDKVQLDHVQEAVTSSLETQSGQSRLKIDTSFLNVGHVDEIYNSMKIGERERRELGLPKECNFVILEASPNKAKSILEENISTANEGSSNESNAAPSESSSETSPSKASSQLSHATSCRDIKHDDISYIYGGTQLPSEEIKAKVKELGCFGLSGRTIQETLDEPFLQVENFGHPKKPNSFALIQEKNRKRLLEEVKKTTGCEQPPIIEVPILVERGLSILPDSVNGVVATNGNKSSGSSFFTPRTFFEPFDDYLDQELNKYGVKSTQVDDLVYHLNNGEVHCGSNTALICKE